MIIEKIVVGEIYWAWLIENDIEMPRQYKLISKKASTINDYDIKILDIITGECICLWEFYLSDWFFETEQESVDAWNYKIEFYTRIRDFKRLEKIKNHIVLYKRYQKLLELYEQ
jgi:hypothetical protein